MKYGNLVSIPFYSLGITLMTSEHILYKQLTSKEKPQFTINKFSTENHSYSCKRKLSQITTDGLPSVSIQTTVIYD